MNRSFQKLGIEEIIFFDCEVVRANDKLDLDSKEYELFQRKTRNRSNDEVLSDDELQEEYQKRAALKRCYNKIVSIGVGFVKDGVVYIKSISGDEETVIKEFVEIANKFKYCCSFNGNSFDLPIIVGNGMKYFNIAETLRDAFNPMGKKPWDLKMCIDLMDVFKGTHYANSSLDEVCYHFDIPSPKDDIDGSQVSDIYYLEGIDRINKYVVQDVFAIINLFNKMQGKDIFKNFTDKSDTTIEDDRSVLQKMYDMNEFPEHLQKELKEIIDGGKKLTKKDKTNLFTILRGVLIRTDFENGDQDSKAVIADKEEDIKEFIESL